MIVIDASTVISRALKDENSALADNALEYVVENGALVLGNFITEVVNALVKAERRKRVSALKAELILNEVLDLPLTFESPDAHAVLAVARAYAITAYDAAYIALALQMGIPLATVDKTLAAAASAAKCGWKPKKRS